MIEKLTKDFPVPIEVLDRAFDSYLQEKDYSHVDLFIRLYIQADHHQRIKQCLELGANPDQILTIELGEDYDKYSIKIPLLVYSYELAVKKKDFTVPNMILEYKPDVNLFGQRMTSDSIDQNIKWINSENPLFLIIKGSLPVEIKLEQIQLLIDHGANLEAMRRDRWTPLSLVREKEVFSFLIQKGADINYITNDEWGHWNMLMLAIFNENQKEVEWCLEHGINFDYIGKDDYEGTINGTPYGPVDIFNFLDYINQNAHVHEVTDPIMEYLDGRERKRIEENSYLPILPKIVRLKLISYLLHPRTTLTEKDFA